MSKRDALKAQIERCEKQMDVADALERLGNNRDFKLLTQHLFQEEVLRLVGELSQHSPEHFEYKEAVRHMDVISCFQGMLKVVAQDGANAREASQLARRYLGENIED